MKGKTAARVLPSIVACLPVLFGVESSNAEVRFGGDASGLLIYDLEEYADLATRPGTALTVLDDWDWGIAFGEKLVGQVTASDGDFDVISGTPSVPLAIDTKVDAEASILILSVSSSAIGVGLGPIGFPLGAAIGEGALTVLYDVDQRVIAFDVIGANGGTMRLQFFDRLGQAVGDIVVEDVANTTYAFSSNLWNIAAVTFTNTDLSGIGFDNFQFDPDGARTGPPNCNLPDWYDVQPQEDATVLALDSGVSEDPDETWWNYSWATDCPGGYFDDDAAPNPTLFLDTADVCRLECSVTLVVDDGYQSDVCTAAVNVEGGEAATVTCPPDLTVEADGFGNVEELEEWLESALAEGGEVVDDFDSLTPACGETGSVTVTWTVEPEGGCGGPASCSATFMIVDTTPPKLEIETATQVLGDLDCDGEEFVTLPLVTASDAAELELDVTDDAPDFFPAGQTTIVTFSATDDCGNTAAATVNVTVMYSSGLEVEVSQQIVNVGRPSGKDRGLERELLGDVVVGLYDSSQGSCAREQIRKNVREPWQVPQAIAMSCEPVNTGVTDGAGVAFVDVPPGSYSAVAHIDLDDDGMPDEYVEQAVGSIPCGHWKNRSLVLHVDEDGYSVFEGDGQ